MNGIATPSQTQQNKLQSIVVDVQRFDNASDLQGEIESKQIGQDCGTVYITLGTTRANAGGATEFEKIDRECECCVERSCN